MARPNTIELWRGASALTGDPIVALASGLAKASKNEKTGDMVQTWILRQDLAPTEAVREGKDAAVCGTCKFRGNGCYVPLRAPQAVWRTWRAGNVPRTDWPIQANKPIRLGAYGDPVAVPLGVWQKHLDAGMGWTGYTHSWKTCDQHFRHVIMASVDNDEEHEAAHALGWRSFRTLPDDGWVVDQDILCPAYTRGTTCATCRLCHGVAPLDRRPDILMPVHGYIKSRALQAISV